jgi:Fe-S cluster assembly ATPase SufC
LNAAVFSDGTFVYVPKGVRCPMELSTYFRINASETGQFERTLIIADEDSTSATGRLHRAQARREPAACRGGRAGGAGQCRDQIFHGAELVSGRRERAGRHLQFRHQARRLPGQKSKISWTQVETGSAITWKYPSCILRGDDSVGEFYSIAIANHYQQADTGTKMIHLGANTRSRIISKGISAGKAQNTYRGWSASMARRRMRRNYTQCDSLLIGGDCGAHTVPYIESRNKTARIEHEATTSKIAEDQLFYCLARGHPAGRGGIFDRQWLLQGSAAAAADGIRGGSAEAGRYQFGRFGGLVMLEIKNLHVAVEGKEILKGLSLSIQPGEVHAIMGPNGSGKSTLSYVLAGRDGYDITEGSVTYNGENLAALPPEERAAKGVFLAMQYPVEIPGVTTMTFLKTALNSQRRARGESDLDAVGVLKLVRAKAKTLNVSEEMLKRALNVGFSGGEKSGWRFSRWRSSSPSWQSWMKPTPAWISMRCDWWRKASMPCASPARAMLVITHYQRLLDYIVPDRIHVLAKAGSWRKAARNWRWSWKPRAMSIS